MLYDTCIPAFQHFQYWRYSLFQPTSMPAFWHSLVAAFQHFHCSNISSSFLPFQHVRTTVFKHSRNSKLFKLWITLPGFRISIQPLVGWVNGQNAELPHPTHRTLSTGNNSRWCPSKSFCTLFRQHPQAGGRDNLP